MGKSAEQLCVLDLNSRGECDVNGSEHAHLQQKP